MYYNYNNIHFYYIILIYIIFFLKKDFIKKNVRVIRFELMTSTWKVEVIPI